MELLISVIGLGAGRILTFKFYKIYNEHMLILGKQCLQNKEKSNT